MWACESVFAIVTVRDKILLKEREGYSLAKWDDNSISNDYRSEVTRVPDD
jgi:hypothetical protein